MFAIVVFGEGKLSGRLVSGTPGEGKCPVAVAGRLSTITGRLDRSLSIWQLT